MPSQKTSQPASTNLINISEPGSIPYVDIPTSNFGEILAASQDVAKKGWVVMTPAGPLVVGYKQIKSILRNPEWISLLSSFSMLDQMQEGGPDLNKMLEKLRK